MMEAVRVIMFLFDEGLGKSHELTRLFITGGLKLLEGPWLKDRPVFGRHDED